MGMGFLIELMLDLLAGFFAPQLRFKNDDGSQGAKERSSARRSRRRMQRAQRHS